MRNNYVLIDYENVRVESLALLKGEHFHVRVFLGPKNTRLPVELVLAMQNLGDRAGYIVLETVGPNALDFHIAYYLGALAAADPTGFFHIISKDTGFDPLIEHLKSRRIYSARSASIEGMPCFKETLDAARVTAHLASELSPKLTAGRMSVEDLVKAAVEDLIKRKASKPRTLQTLRSTIQAKCGKELPAWQIDAVYEAMVRRGYIKLTGEMVTYSLPAD